MDSATELYQTQPKFSSKHPTLVRERHGWCPYSERVWLALELKSLTYDTLRVDNTGHGPKPSYVRGRTTPHMIWEDGRWQGESMDLVRELDARYSTSNSSSQTKLYPPGMEDEVEDAIKAFTNIYPRGSRPSSRAAYLFRSNGEPLFKSEFQRVLSETDQLLSRTADDGPFFCGHRVTAADVAWAPFLERYAAQLPCLHSDLDPRSKTEYPHLSAWYHAMDTHVDVAVYPCRIKGNASSWRKVLGMAGYGNMGNVPLLIQERMNEEEEKERELYHSKENHHHNNDDDHNNDHDDNLQQIWNAYASTRPWVAHGPAREAASIIIRNRKAIVEDCYYHYNKQSYDDGNSYNNDNNNNSNNNNPLPHSKEELDHVLQMLAWKLIAMEKQIDDDVCRNIKKFSQDDTINIQRLAKFLDERMCVPRDMGSLSASCVKKLSIAC